MGKAEMLWRNGALPSLRPLAPLALILGFVTLIVVGLFTQQWAPLAVLAGLWILLPASVAVRSDESPPGVFLAAAIMHLAYGIGVLSGLLRGGNRSDISQQG
jgi:hypothetical protein